MKSLHLLLASALTLPLLGQQPSNLSAPATIVSRTAHTRTWARIAADTNQPPSGAFTELASGLCFWNAQTAAYEDSSPDFTLTEKGYALAERCQHKLLVSPRLDDPDGVVDCVMPDGQRLRGIILGLVLTSHRTGESLQIAAVKTGSAGEQTAPNEITFTDGFEGMLRASVRIRNEIGQWHQDIILHERFSKDQLEKLARIGFDNPAEVRLEVWSEFLQAPEAKVESTVLKTLPGQNLAEPYVMDDRINFQTMFMPQGTGFLETDPEKAVIIKKQWLDSERKCLIESASLDELLPLMSDLPESTMTVRNETDLSKGLLASRSPPARPKGAKDQEIKIAKYDPSNRHGPGEGLCWDYTTMNGTLTNFTAHCDETVYVSGNATIVGTFTIEGLSVLKFTNFPYASIYASNVVCLTGPYTPAVLTSKDQNGVGVNIDGSTGTPTGYYAYNALNLNSSSTNQVLSNLRFCYLKNAVVGPNVTLRDCQLIQCGNVFGTASVSSQPKLLNVLLYKVNQAVGVNPYGVYLTGEHVTAHYCTNFMALTTGVIRLTNSLLVCVTNWYSTYTYTNGTVALNSDSGVFQTVGGADHYLADSSPYRNAGTTNTSLLAARRTRTTYPPIVYSNATISVDTVLGPQAQRDTDTPDIGYAYAPLDHAFGGCTVNSNLTFSSGTAVGWFRTTSGWQHAGHGIHLADRQSVTFNGTEEAPTYWVRCNVVQESCNGLWYGGYGPGGITGWAWPNIADSPQINARFTRFAMLAADTSHYRDDWGWLMARATHCEYFGSSIGFYNGSHQYTNCLFDRTPIGISSQSLGADVYLRNCTQRGGVLSIGRTQAATNAPAVVRECAFDGTLIYTNSGNPAVTYYNYNAFLNSSSRLVPIGANDVLVSTFNWQPGLLGNFYLPTNSSLINTGGVSAAAAGLYHFTTQTTQTKEAASTVDLSYHYVACTNGVPIDTDGDLTSDYLEDYNGNGNGADDATNWQIYNSPNGLAPGTGLQVFTPLK